MEFDLVLHDATVLIGDSAATRARSIGLLDGRVAAVSDDVLPGKRRVSLEGRTVAPGFHDAHCHTSWYGTSLAGLPLATAATADDICDMVAAKAATTPAGAWIIGSGYHPLHLSGPPPTRRALDRAAPDHPVWLIASSGHASTLNSPGLARLDLDAVEQVSPLQRDEHGELTGFLEEHAHTCVLEQAQPYGTEDIVDAVGRAHDEYLKVGITAVQEAGIGAGLVGYGASELGAYQEARERGLLRVRTTLMPSASSLHQVGSDAARSSYGLDLGMRNGFGDDWLRIGPVKFFTDGSILARTADLHGGYPDLDAASHLHYDRGDIAARLVAAHASGWQVAVHAQGDGAIDFVLDCFEKAQAERPRTDPRHRIEHCSVTTPDAVDRITRLGVVPSPQGRFVGVVGDGLLDLLDEEQLTNTYRMKTYLDRGITVAGSSDRPCTEGTPLRGIHDMVNRRTDSGALFGAGEAVSVHEAMRSYAHGSAFAIHQERRMGTLEPGMLADLVVLSDDPTSVAPDEVRDVEVVATAVGGQFAYDPEGLFG